MKRLSIYIVLIGVFCSCSNTDTPSTPPTPILPEAAILITPLKNESCNNGVVISETTSTIRFTWEASKNTDSYELCVKNLLNNEVIAQIAATNYFELILKRNTPYSWYVNSKSSKTKEISKSETWKFFNAGLAATNYVPFPAEIVAPKMNVVVIPSGGNVTLNWTGFDIDNDIVGYDIYFGTTSTPPLFQSNVGSTVNSLNVPVTSNTYYWKVITKDKNGNSSDSGMFKFIVN